MSTQRNKRVQSITIWDKDRKLLSDIAKQAPKFKGKISTGIEMLCDMYRAQVVNFVKK